MKSLLSGLEQWTDRLTAL